MVSSVWLNFYGIFTLKNNHIAINTNHPYLKALLGSRGSGLYGSDEDADLVATGQTDTNAAVLLEADESGIGTEKRKANDQTYWMKILSKM